MRRLFAVFMLVSLLVASFIVFVLPVSAAVSATGSGADTQCWEAGFIFRNDTSSSADVFIEIHDVPQTVSNSRTASLQPGETQNVTIHLDIPTGHGVNSSSNSLTATFVGFGNFGPVDSKFCNPGFIDDGRINAYDLGAPLAAYCKSGGIQVWDIDDQGQGTLAFTASADDISAGLDAAVSSGQNQLIAQGLGDSLYALMSNQLALFGPDVKEAGKTYQFIAAGDVCG